MPADDRVAQPDRRPLVVRKAHDLTWHLGIKAADDVTHALVEARHKLLKAGFPPVHALCEDLDKDAGKWAAHATQMRRDRAKGHNIRETGGTK